MIMLARTASSIAASIVQRPLAQILDQAGELLQLRILRQRGGSFKGLSQPAIAGAMI